MQVEQDFLKKMKFKLVKMSALAMCRKLAVMEERKREASKVTAVGSKLEHVRINQKDG